MKHLPPATFGPRPGTGRPSSWTDAQMLEALDLMDHGGLSARAVADRLGRPLGSVDAMRRRTSIEARELFPSDSSDGSLPRGWWRRP